MLDHLYRELGELGRDFLTQVSSPKIREEINDNPDRDEDVYYTNYSIERGFLDRIFYGRSIVDNQAALFTGRTHEAVHALQYRNAGILHHDPYNPRARVVLSPESYLQVRELMEREAYAKEALFSALLSFMKPEMTYELARYTACDQSLFPKLVEAYFDEADLPQALAAAADSAMAARIDYDGRDMSFQELYWEKILDGYEEAMQDRLGRPGGRQPVFARADEKDLLSLGRTVGPSSLGADGALFAQSRSVYPPAVRERIAALNEKYGVAAGSNTAWHIPAPRRSARAPVKTLKPLASRPVPA